MYIKDNLFLVKKIQFNHSCILKQDYRIVVSQFAALGQDINDSSSLLQLSDIYYEDKLENDNLGRRDLTTYYLGPNNNHKNHLDGTIFYMITLLPSQLILS